MPSIGELVGGMLDTGYARAAQPTLRAVAATMNSPLINQRLAELNAEAARLASGDKKLTPDNPVLRALIVDMEPALKRAASAIDGGAGGITDESAALAQTATKALANPGVGVAWNVPDPAAVAALIDYADKPGWAGEMAKYPSLTLDVLINQAARGMAEGWGPLKVARNIVSQAQALPLAQATMLTRTLYLESYRSATAANQEVNKDILEKSIRIEVLDDRICLACLALHGTEVPVGQKIHEHHAGRGTVISVVRGRPRAVQTGEQWFNSLPEARQMAIAGPGAFEALKSGQAQLRDFVQSYSDPVFGEMVRQASLKGMGVR
jgi:hypothetical protein